jgi:ankyrin repeat protein
MPTDPPSTAWGQYAQTMPAPTSLYAAARANDVVQLARLLDEGNPIDERDDRGYAPLMLAGYAGHLEAVELLLARGADPNTTDLFGNTVLMGAAYKGFVKIVLRLLAAGADPAALNNGGLDARGFALTYGHPEVFAVLEHHAQRGSSRTIPRHATAVPAPLPTATLQPALLHSN